VLEEKLKSIEGVQTARAYRKTKGAVAYRASEHSGRLFPVPG
jgi:hypothetical protein